MPKADLSDDLSDRGGAEPTLDRAIQDRIGTHLRAMYDDLVNQPVPDRFAELLGRLDRGEKEGRR
ncbi:MAG TPA: NepR family anti-sigma factor [Beijerinckiaceae bacterium]|nr:NepR family anti-sigma factor [Beijerinckiaceae bacterium]